MLIIFIIIMPYCGCVVLQISVYPSILSFFSLITRSAEDANVFLVNDFENPLQVHIILIYSFGWLVELLLLLVY